MIKGKSTGTGFFCCTNYENKNIPCLITNYQVIDDEYIKENKKIEISLNDNEKNGDIIVCEQDIIYQSKKDEYDLIVIKVKEGQEYIKFINYLELNDILFGESLKGYNSIYIPHYANTQNAAVSYGICITYDTNYKYDMQIKFNTLSGPSGGPILNLLTNKVIGIYIKDVYKKMVKSNIIQEHC